MSDVNGEARLAAPLLKWLERRRRIATDTLIVRELPWHGRHIDLVTLTKSGCLSAYELKLSDTRRAIHQAAFNGLAFDQSFIVTVAEPSEKNRARAIDAGVGIILIKDGDARLLQRAATSPVKELRTRARRAIRERRSSV